MTRILNNSNLPQGIEDCWSFFVGWLMHDVQKFYIYIYIFFYEIYIFVNFNGIWNSYSRKEKKR